MDDFCYQRQGLKCPWAKILEQQKFSEIVEVAFVSDCKHGAETFQIHVFGSHVVTCREFQVTRCLQRTLRTFVGDLEQSGLYRLRLRIDEIHDRALVLARSEEHTSELQSQSNLVCR